MLSDFTHKLVNVKDKKGQKDKKTLQISTNMWICYIAERLGSDSWHNSSQPQIWLFEMTPWTDIQAPPFEPGNVSVSVSVRQAVSQCLLTGQSVSVPLRS